MKKVFYLIALVLSANCAIAQTGYGPEIGLGFSTMHFAPNLLYTSASTSAIFSGKIGGNVDLKMNQHLYAQIGIFVSRKGQTRSFSYDSSNSNNEYDKQTLTINYFDLPLNLLYKTGKQGQGRFFVGLGVTASYIIGGKNKITSTGVYNDTAYSLSGSTKVVAGNPLAGFDLGINFIAGYELPTGLFFKAYYTLGGNDIGLGTEIDKNRMGGISIGYFFGKGRDINKEEDLIEKD